MEVKKINDYLIAVEGCKMLKENKHITILLCPFVSKQGNHAWGVRGFYNKDEKISAGMVELDEKSQEYVDQVIVGLV